MTKEEAIVLINGGILEVSSHDLDNAQAYKVFKLKKALRDLQSSIDEEEKELFKEVGIEDTRAFFTKVEEVRSKKEKNEKDLETIKDANLKIEKFNSLRLNMLQEEVSLDGVKPIPYDDWRKLQKENKSVEVNGKNVDILSGTNELILADVFWLEPKEESESESRDGE